MSTVILSQTVHVDVESLRGMALFADMPEADLRAVANQAELWLIGAGTALIRQGDPSDSLFIIQAGRAEVVVTQRDGTEDVIGHIGPGESAGELGLLAGTRRTATVRSVEPVVAAVLRADAFQLAMTQPGFALQMAVDVGRRLSLRNRARALETLAKRRARQLTAVYRIEELLHRSLRREDVLQALVDIAADVLEADKTSVLVWDDAHERLVVGATRGFSPSSLAGMSHGPGEGVTYIVATTGEPIAIEDAATDPRVAHRITGPEGIASLLHVPIRLGGEVFGVYGVNYCQPRVFTGDEERVLMALAQQAGLALENARLFESERLTRERLELALESGAMGTWDWDPFTNRLTGSRQLAAVHGRAPDSFPATFEAYLSDVHPEDVARVRQAIAESLTLAQLDLEYRIVWPDTSIHWVEARGRLLRDQTGQPVRMRGVCLDVTVRKENENERGRLLQRERAALKTKAALEERQKLARELHDSVSQALYGIALGTQAGLDALANDRDTDAAADAMQYVLELAEAGLAEMRSLIFELRPETLQQEGLAAALHRHAAVARSRHALQVVTELGPEPDLALASKEALYRIAQEALHNIVKHAHASSVRLSLQSDDAAVVLDVADDGTGFDPDAGYLGHLGLTSMRERAASIGAELVIRSAAGQGARVHVRVPVCG